MGNIVVKVIIFFLRILIKIFGHKYVQKIIVYLFRKHWEYVAHKYKAERSENKKKMLKPKLAWLPIPIINLKYWSKAQRNAGYEATTFVYDYYVINKQEDYDFYIYNKNSNIHLKYNKIKVLLLNFANLFPIIRLLLATNYIIKNYDILHIPFKGGFLGDTIYSEYEAILYKKFGNKIIILPYGGDMYKYSEIIDPVLRHAMLINYPEAAINEQNISAKVSYWARYADCLIPNLAIDGMGRWSILPYNNLCIDLELWQSKTTYSQANGINQAVNIIHTPNHRGVKATEFLTEAIRELKEEGLLINLILLEKKPNDEVRRIMNEEADILAEQFVFNAYAMSGIEGMASGIAVLANLDNPVYTRLFRLYSFLNECPVLSTPHEHIKNNVKILVKNPQLREELGRAGRKYVEKYHSYQTSQYMFGKIYDKIWYEKEVDLMNMFHPLMPNSYNNQSPKIQHPLIENKIPQELLDTLNK